MTGFAFVALGILIGTLIAFSETSLAGNLIALLFAFAGGSVIALAEKLTAETRRWASLALFALSCGALLGVYSGILLREYRLLSPPGSGAPVGPRFLLRRALSDRAAAIDQLHETGQLTAEEAYDQLVTLIQEQQ